MASAVTHAITGTPMINPPAEGRWISHDAMPPMMNIWRQWYRAENGRCYRFYGAFDGMPRPVAWWYGNE